MRTLLLALTAAWMGTAIASPVAADVPLSVAVRTGKVNVTVTGRGASSGDAINLYLQKRVPGTLQIEIEPGTVFRSKSGKVQSMVFRRLRFERVAGGYKQTSKIILDTNVRRHFILECYCRDHGKPTPQASDQFVIESVNKAEAAIIAQGNKVNVTNKVLQVAIWMHRSSDRPANLRPRFSVTTEEFRVASGLVASADQRAQQTTAANAAATDIEVELKNLMAGLRKRIQASRAAARYRRGDRVKVGTSGAELTATRNGKRVLLKLRPGLEVEVLREAGDRVLCIAKQDTATRRGWLAAADLQSGRNPTQDKPRDGLLRESALEFLDKIDINVRAGAAPR